MTTDQDLRARREAIVVEHMESENHHDYETTMGTFGHPRYEIIPTGDVWDGDEEVRRYFEDTRAAFPDQRNELIELHHADAGVIVEFMLKGTHEGPLRGIPATGKSFECRCTAFFLFDGDSLVCERVYFDAATILSQLGLVQPAPSLGSDEH
ncbi:MAG: ester cyclase [Actinomycetota bacterium]|nr:ester cyclase [Actinomycetota bacterium]